MNYWGREWANHDISDFRKYINPERDYMKGIIFFLIISGPIM